MNKNACGGSARLNKSTLLGVMGYPRFSQKPFVEPTLSDEKMDFVMKVLSDNGGDYGKASIILGTPASRLKRWVKAWNQPSPNNSESGSPNLTRGFYEKIQNPWSIRSFDPVKREVCIDIETNVGTNHLSYTIANQKTSEY